MQKSNDHYNDILLVNKPIGMTSHDVVAKLRRILGQKRIGHTGTLDKSASGLLVVCLGRATKTAQFISDADKSYQAEITFGRQSKTYDAEGVDFSQPENNVPEFDIDALDRILHDFRGTITQKVPAYSAVHVDGKRLYQLAVKGEITDIPEREVSIYAININSYLNKVLNMTVTCSKGTYVRSLAHDLGQRIGCGAYISNLKRLTVGNLNLSHALELSEIETLHENNELPGYLLSFSQVSNYVSCSINDESIDMIFHGQNIQQKQIDTIDGSFETGDKVALKDSKGNILAVCKAETDSCKIDDSENQKLFSYIRVLN